MEALAEYVQKLCCAALICGILLGITGTDGPGSALQRMVCGMFLVILAVAPLRNLDAADLNQDFEFFSEAAEAAAMEGRRQAEAETDRVISEACRAYILDKAAAWKIPVEAEVEVDPASHLPVRAVLTGRASKEQKMRLGEEIFRSLGIERSCQQWISPDSSSE